MDDSLIAAAAAAANVFPDIRFSRNCRTCASVTQPVLHEEIAQSHMTLGVRLSDRPLGRQR